MLQKEEVFKLVTAYQNHNYFLETNGTIYDGRMSLFSKISCSPKKQAVSDYEKFSSYYKIAMLPNSTFKFVYENKNDKWWESFIEKNQISKDDVYIMPEGATRKEQMKRMPEVMEYCADKGFKFGARLHVLAHDDRRGI